MSKSHPKSDDPHAQGAPDGGRTADQPQFADQPLSSTGQPPEIQALLQQIGELTEALQRERADAVNVRRRSDEERAKLSDFYKALVVRELLPVIDNFERALKHAPKELEGSDYVKGVQGVVKQFEQALQKLGVQRIKTAGEPFDPRFHEAVSMEDSDGETETVSEELQAGYVLGTEVIRHAMVRVKMA